MTLKEILITHSDIASYLCNILKELELPLASILSLVATSCVLDIIHAPYNDFNMFNGWKCPCVLPGCGMDVNIFVDISASTAYFHFRLFV